MNLIACIDKNLGIGLKGNLLYNIPQDMEYFKTKTYGKTVIMGSKTYQSLRVKPLPNRRNIVLSKSLSIPDIEVCKSKIEVLELIKDTPKNDIYIIGGNNIYETFLDVTSMAYITKVYSSSMADVFFPIDFENSPNWILLEKSKIYEYQGLKYSFNTYKKVFI
ncbi:MAG: dihydrofolate reductase [Oscillospiraceae bacterium]